MSFWLESRLLMSSMISLSYDWKKHRNIILMIHSQVGKIENDFQLQKNEIITQKKNIYSIMTFHNEGSLVTSKLKWRKMKSESIINTKNGKFCKDSVAV